MNFLKRVSTFLLTSLLFFFLVNHAAAATLFSDQFTGTGELSAYNNNYSLLQGSYTPSYLISNQVSSTNGASFYLYKAIQPQNNCTSFDFNSSTQASVMLRTLQNPNPQILNLFQYDQVSLNFGSTWYYYHVDNDGTQISDSGSISYNTGQTHNLKGCIIGNTVTAYLDGNPFLTKTTASIGGYSGFGLAQGDSLDNFKIESVGQWSLTGPLTTPHAFAPLVTLQNGKVLEISGASTEKTELYDEATGVWTQTGSLSQGRDQINAVVLNNGKVLIAGGRTSSVFRSTEIYDPSTGLWTSSGDLNTARTAAIVVKLADGRVLANSGYDSSFNGIKSTEIYDPSTGVWTPATDSNISHQDYGAGSSSNAVLLNDGRVLAVSTTGGDSAYGETYDPTTDQWTLTGALAISRSSAHLIKLQNGKVLMVGGATNNSPVFFADTEIYDPATNQWTQTGPLTYGRYGNDAVLMPDGKVLTAGGLTTNNGNVLDVLPSEIYDPSTGAWTVDASLNSEHNGGNMAIFPDGKILMVGGYGDNGPTPVSELYTSTPPRQLTSLSPAKIWVGLKNSDDVGVKFDLKADAYANGSLVSTGETDSVNAGSSGFNNAKLDTINFASFSPVSFPSGSTLAIKLYVRNACTGSGHNSGTARLWYNDSTAYSEFGATINSSTSNYYLVSSAALSTSFGSGPKQTIDVASGAKCSAFKLFGTWTGTP